MTASEYEFAWVAYLIAALGCFWVWTFFTRWMWRYLREPLWLIVAVILFSPSLVDVEGSTYVPSLAMAAMDILFKVNNDAWRALSDMSLYFIVAFLVYLVFVVLRWLWQRWRTPKTEPKSRGQSARSAKPAAKANKPSKQVKSNNIEPTLREIMQEQGGMKQG